MREWARGRDDPGLRNMPLFPAYSCVRPEPVLVKRSLISIKRLRKAFFAPPRELSA